MAEVIFTRQYNASNPLSPEDLEAVARLRDAMLHDKSIDIAGVAWRITSHDINHEATRGYMEVVVCGKRT